MLTSLQILRACPQLVKDNSRFVKIIAVRKHRTKKRGIHQITATVQTRIPGQPERPIRHIYIRNAVLDKTMMYKDAIKVHCTCEFHHWYGVSDVLFKNGAGFKNKKTGIMPDIRNPGYLVFCCKHVYVILRLLRKEKK